MNDLISQLMYKYWVNTNKIDINFIIVNDTNLFIVHLVKLCQLLILTWAYFRRKLLHCDIPYEKNSFPFVKMSFLLFPTPKSSLTDAWHRMFPASSSQYLYHSSPSNLGNMEKAVFLPSISRPRTHQAHHILHSQFISHGLKRAKIQMWWLTSVILALKRLKQVCPQVAGQPELYGDIQDSMSHILSSRHGWAIK